MRKSLFQLLLGCLGTFLCIGYSCAVQTAQVEQMAPAVKSNQSQVRRECNLQENQEVDSKIAELLEQTKQYTNSKNTEKATDTLIQVFQLAQTLDKPQIKANLLDEIVSNEVRTTDSGLLGDVVEQYAASVKKEQAATLISQALQAIQTLGSGYSFVKTRTLATIAGHFAAIGQAEQALKIIPQSLEIAKSIQGAEFKTKALTEIAKAYVAVGQPEPAAAILSQSLQFATAVKYPNPYRRGEIFAEIAITYAKAGYDKQTIQIAQTITDAAYYKASAIAAIASHYPSGQLAQALQIAQTIDLADIRAKTLAEIGIKYAHGQQDKAADVFSEAIKSAQTVETAYDRRSTTLAEIAVKYAEAGQLDMALQASRTISKLSIKAKALAAIALLYAKAGQQTQASLVESQTLELVRAIPSDNEKADVLQEIIRNAVKAGQYDYAIQAAPEDTINNKAETLQQIASQAVEAGQYDIAIKSVQLIDTSFVDYRNRALQEIAIAYAKAKQYDKALQIAQTIENSGSTYTYRAKTLAAIARIYIQAGQTERASEVLSQALATANALEFAGSRAEALAAVALYAMTGQQNKATEILSQALQVAQTIKDSASKSHTLQEIVEQYIAAEQYEAALLVVKQMTEKSQSDSKVEEIINKYIESGQYDKSLELINDLQAPEAKVRILLAIASKYIQLGQKNKVSEILAQAFQVAQTVAGPESKSIVLRIDYDSKGNAIPITQIDDPADRGSLLEDIAIKYAQAGQYNQALRVAQAIENSVNRNQLSLRLACYR